MKKKRRLKPKIRIFITLVVAIVLFGYLSFSAINYGISKAKYENEEKELNEKLNSLKDKEDDLNQEIGKLKDDDYLARYAREEYLYSKDGEYVIKIEEGKQEEKEEEKKTNSYTKIVIIVCVAILVIGTIIIFTNKKKTKKKEIKKDIQQ